MGDAETAVRRLWAALDRRDWDAVAAELTDDCLYLDVPTGPAAAAKGPVDVVKRLRLGLADLAAYENFDGVLAVAGDDVLYEHAERWTFSSGEVLDLPFVSVHRVRDGRVCLWKDYWDYGAVANAAPPGWIEAVSAGDLSWVYDATGEV